MRWLSAPEAAQWQALPAALQTVYQVFSQTLGQMLDQTQNNRAAPDCRIRIGLSGGLDSVVLLHLAACWQAQQPTPVSLGATHVHHGLQTVADDWPEFCQQLCDALDIPLTVEHCAVQSQGDGIEQAARQARYAAFQKHCQPGELLLLAHHADDQLETLFSRLSRGSGLAGLAGIPARRLLDRRQADGAQILRPLLQCSRAQLQQWADYWQLEWIEDPSNQDTLLERNWWRQQLLPQIQQRFPGRQAALYRSANQLQQDQQAFELLLQPLLQQCCQPSVWPATRSTSLELDVWRCQPQLLQSYILRGWLDRHGVLNPDRSQLDECQRQLQQGEPELALKLVDQHGQILWLQRHQQSLYLLEERSAAGIGVDSSDVDSREVDSREVGSSEVDSRAKHWLELVVPQADQVVHEPWQCGLLSCEAVKPAQLALTQLLIKPGCYQLSCLAELSVITALSLRPMGRPTKKLKHLWQEAGIPVWLRQRWPLLLNEQKQLVAVVGIALDQSVDGSGCETAVRLRWARKDLN
ncbi:tRNA lysidine(34) synthetase TilS [Oceanobacter mangrovi]|uniref:tRNA lysidine(34) synthetase TilS n=1 Tax=Oceanobacter mangrovi TaxID=2862510 RepID=UPI001C8E21E3|nr:tRNA lysidine(34) synthetase TilS [Oceanobacter mangrovi]